MKHAANKRNKVGYGYLPSFTFSSSETWGFNCFNYKENNISL